MVNGGVFLSFHGFSGGGFGGGFSGGGFGGGFGNLLNQWEQIGVFSFMLPFLLIFAIIYGILSKMKLFGDENNKSINAIIALSVSLMSLQFGIVSVFFAEILPRFGVALGGVLVLLILIGLFGNPNNKGFSNTMMWGSFAVAIFIILQSLEIFNPGFGGSLFLNLIPYEWIPWIAIFALVALVVGSATKPSNTPLGGHLIEALGGAKS